MDESPKRRAWLREPFCGWSHLFGAALSVAALVVLLILARGRPWHIVSFAIYGAALIILYSASALYHSLWIGPKAVDRFRRFDHCAIFLLIAGTYTPLCLVAIRGVWGWSLMGIEYGLMTIGIVLSLTPKRLPSWLRVAIYICMGWLVMFAVPLVVQSIGSAAFGWLLAGGLFYSIGTVVFATDRPHLWPGKFMAHDLWHVFVLGGSACHFVLMLYIAGTIV